MNPMLLGAKFAGDSEGHWVQMKKGGIDHSREISLNRCMSAACHIKQLALWYLHMITSGIVGISGSYPRGTGGSIHGGTAAMRNLIMKKLNLRNPIWLQRHDV